MYMYMPITLGDSKHLGKEERAFIKASVFIRINTVLNLTSCTCLLPKLGREETAVLYQLKLTEASVSIFTHQIDTD